MALFTGIEVCFDWLNEIACW